ncbi:efflux RND transporter periplasmic adaptor subunit [Halobacillus sp. A1]|uniref:efflux RND transporter periplasmic adaptor subunit n=1 Tax=Halobacillus sp. A1 TaxID=2880262 RepID=UPI0020A6DA18|nr:efflux RND transporter periplasmic adaptor subunit [Halobacillus sp. A1]MCP3029758.1 efflux RND transporter periplasmic adaptor subunit [Halobacillus sp. A1]
MKSSRKTWWIGISVFIFVAANSLLLYFDSQQKVERKSFVSEWSGTFVSDLEETIELRGVFSSADASPVYFDEQTGAFQEFSVKVGDEVNEGDELYSYEVVDYEAQSTELEQTAAKIQSEIDAIDTYVSELENYTIEEESSNDTSFNPFGELEEEEDLENELEETAEENSTAEAELLKEEAIAAQEKERSQKEAELTMVEDQLDELTTTGQTITVTSAIDGFVTERSENLQSPLLTLSSAELKLEGEVNEEDHKVIEEDMEARIRTDGLDEVELTGTIDQLSSVSEHTHVDKVSQYPFEIALTDIDDEVKTGYHADVEVITDQSLEAVTAFEESLVTDKNLYAWEMTNEGILRKRTLETGLQEDDKVEIIDGLDYPAQLAKERKDQFQDGTIFITPIDSQNLKYKEIFQNFSAQMKEKILLGLLNR